MGMETFKSGMKSTFGFIPKMRQKTIKKGTVLPGEIIIPVEPSEASSDVAENSELSSHSATFLKNLADFCLCVTVKEARNLPAFDVQTNSIDPFCEVTVGTVKQKTRIIYRNRFPMWQESLIFPLETVKPTDEINLTLKDKNFARVVYVGEVVLSLSEALTLLDREHTWFTLLAKKAGTAAGGEVCLVFSVVSKDVAAQIASASVKTRDPVQLAKKCANLYMQVELQGLNGWKSSGIERALEDHEVCVRVGKAVVKKPLKALVTEEKTVFEVPLNDKITFPLNTAFTKLALQGLRGKAANAELPDVRLYIKKPTPKAYAGMYSDTVAKTQVPIWAVPEAAEDNETQSHISEEASKGQASFPAAKPSMATTTGTGSPPIKASAPISAVVKGAEGSPGVPVSAMKSGIPSSLAPGLAMHVTGIPSSIARPTTPPGASGPVGSAPSMAAKDNPGPGIGTNLLRAVLGSGDKVTPPPSQAGDAHEEDEDEDLGSFTRVMQNWDVLDSTLEITFSLLLVKAACDDSHAPVALEDDDDDSETDVPDAKPVPAPAPLEHSCVDTDLPCGVNKLFCTIMDRESEFMKKWNEKQGLKEVTPTPWVMVGGQKQRTASYIKPLNIPIPMAPKSAKCVETLTLHLKEDGGWVCDIRVDTQAPKGDAFFVLAQFFAVIKGPNQCHLRVTMKVEWLKSILGQRLIETSAINDTKRNMQELVKQVLASLGATDTSLNRSAGALPGSGPVSHDSAATPAAVSGLAWLPVVQVLAVLLLFWLVLTVRSVSSELNGLRKTLAQLAAQQLQAAAALAAAQPQPGAIHGEL